MRAATLILVLISSVLAQVGWADADSDFRNATEGALTGTGVGTSWISRIDWLEEHGGEDGKKLAGKWVVSEDAGTVALAAFLFEVMGEDAPALSAWQKAIELRSSLAAAVPHVFELTVRTDRVAGMDYLKSLPPRKRASVMLYFRRLATDTELPPNFQLRFCQSFAVALEAVADDKKTRLSWTAATLDELAGQEYMGEHLIGGIGSAMPSLEAAGFLREKRDAAYAELCKSLLKNRDMGREVFGRLVESGEGSPEQIREWALLALENGRSTGGENFGAIREKPWPQPDLELVRAAWRLEKLPELVKSDIPSLAEIMDGPALRRLQGIARIYQCPETEFADLSRKFVGFHGDLLPTVRALADRGLEVKIDDLILDDLKLQFANAAPIPFYFVCYVGEVRAREGEAGVRDWLDLLARELLGNRRQRKKSLAGERGGVFLGWIETLSKQESLFYVTAAFYLDVLEPALSGADGAGPDWASHPLKQRATYDDAQAVFEMIKRSPMGADLESFRSFPYSPGSAHTSFLADVWLTVSSLPAAKREELGKLFVAGDTFGMGVWRSVFAENPTGELTNLIVENRDQIEAMVFRRQREVGAVFAAVVGPNTDPDSLIGETAELAGWFRSIANRDDGSKADRLLGAASWQEVAPSSARFISLCGSLVRDAFADDPKEARKLLARIRGLLEYPATFEKWDPNSDNTATLGGELFRRILWNESGLAMLDLLLSEIGDPEHPPVLERSAPAVFAQPLLSILEMESGEDSDTDPEGKPDDKEGEKSTLAELQRVYRDVGRVVESRNAPLLVDGLLAIFEKWKRDDTGNYSQLLDWLAREKDGGDYEELGYAMHAAGEVVRARSEGLTLSAEVEGYYQETLDDTDISLSGRLLLLEVMGSAFRTSASLSRATDLIADARKVRAPLREEVEVALTSAFSSCPINPDTQVLALSWLGDPHREASPAMLSIARRFAQEDVVARIYEALADQPSLGLLEVLLSDGRHSESARLLADHWRELTNERTWFAPREKMKATDLKATVEAVDSPGVRLLAALLLHRIWPDIATDELVLSHTNDELSNGLGDERELLETVLLLINESGVDAAMAKAQSLLLKWESNLARDVDLEKFSPVQKELLANALQISMDEGPERIRVWLARSKDQDWVWENYRKGVVSRHLGWRGEVRGRNLEVWEEARESKRQTFDSSWNVFDVLTAVIGSGADREGVGSTEWRDWKAVAQALKDQSEENYDGAMEALTKLMGTPSFFRLMIRDKETHDTLFQELASVFDVTLLKTQADAWARALPRGGYASAEVAGWHGSAGEHEKALAGWDEAIKEANGRDTKGWTMFRLGKAKTLIELKRNGEASRLLKSMDREKIDPAQREAYRELLRKLEKTPGASNLVALAANRQQTNDGGMERYSVQGALRTRRTC